MSSKAHASTQLADEADGLDAFRSIALSALISMSASSLANTLDDEKIRFEIPQQRADLSLTEFAKQANITLIFPFDDAMETHANALVGEFTIEEAIRILLSNTQLLVNIGEQGQLTIITDQSSRETDSMHKKNKVSSAVAGVISSLIGAQAIAQDKAAEEEVIVTGIRGSLQRSLDIKRESSGVVDAISAEDIGKFPDTNLAESLQRITGVSIDRSGGEGQLITVRGFGPQFNTVLVNGRQIASENLSRAFSFDTLASELVSGLEVHKTSTATMQSGGVGSTVNVKTARPLDFAGMKLAGSVKMVKDDNSGETDPQMSGLFSYSADNFGVLVALSHSERQTRLNQAQMDGWLEFQSGDGGIPEAELNNGAGLPAGTTYFSPRNYDHKVTFEERTRTNGNLVLQFAPSDNVTLTGDFLYSDFDVDTEALSYGHWFTASNVENATTDANNTVIDLYQEEGLATDMHHKTFDRLTETTAFGFNVDWTVSDNLNLNFDLSISSAEREPNNGGGNQLSLIGYANRVRFINDDNILPYYTDFASADPSIFSGQQEIDGVAYRNTLDPTYVPPAGVDEFLSEDNSRAHVMLRRGWAVEDDVTQIKMDGTWDEGASTGLVSTKFGVQISSEEKALDRWDNEGVGIHCTYCGYPDGVDVVDQYVFDAGNDFLGEVSGSGRMPTRWLAHDGEAQFALLEQQSGLNFDAVKRNNSFVVEEETLSAYMEFEFAGELANKPISAIAGVRIEDTSVDVTGTTAPVTGLTILDETEMLAQFGSVEAISKSKSYEAILPNMSVKWDVAEDIVARAAASKTLTRPTLESMSPVTVITTTRQGNDLRSSSGNSELEPFESDNFDLSIEWYYGDTSYVSGGYFKKDVANFIVNTLEDRTFALSDGTLLTDPSTGTDDSAPDAGDNVAVFSNTLPTNGENATVNGFEIAWQHAWGETGFGNIINATFVSSNADLDPEDTTQTFALTGLSDSLNLVAYYEQGPFQIRLAYNWRDEFVQSLTQTAGNGPTIVEDYSQWDISGSYDFTDQISVFFEGINLTEEYVHKRGRYDNHLLLVEDSGRRLALGVRASF